MSNHASKDYVCPFCLIVTTGSDGQEDRVQDIVFKNDKVTAFIPSHWWPNNPGHVVVVPNEHFENLYDLPSEFGYAIHDVAKKIAIAMKKAYECEGISTRQHNELAGNQSVWHFHIHVFPRWENDDLYTTEKSYVPATKRAEYAQKLREQIL